MRKIDRAVQLVVERMTGGAKLVSASEVEERFGGEELPPGLRFACPCCMREVMPAAFGDGYKVEPHFRHRRNDDLAQFCENYMSGSGSTENDYREPVIPLFLRRSSESAERFVVEIGFWRSGETFRKSMLGSDSWVTVEERKYPLWQFANPNFKIRIQKLHLAVSDEIQFQGMSSKTSIGIVENAKQAFVFNDDFDGDGGKRVRFQDSIKSDRDYYVVAAKAVGKQLKRAFSKVEHVGTVQGDGELFDVTRVCILADSRRRELAEQVLASFGYCLTDYDRSAKLIWPPSANLYGVDSPILRDSPIVYKPQFRTNDEQEDDEVSLHSVGEQYGLTASDVGVIGDTGRELQTDCEAGCFFVKLDRFHPWSPFASDNSIIQSLELSDLDECTVNLSESNTDGGKPYVEINGRYPIQAEILTRHNLSKRLTVDLNSEKNIIPLDYRQIIRILASALAFPKEWQLTMLDASTAHVADVNCTSEVNRAISERRLITEFSLGYRIAVNRLEGKDWPCGFEKRFTLLVKERERNGLV